MKLKSINLEFDSAIIQEKICHVLSIAKEKGIDINNPVLVNFDMNGPLTATNDASLTFYPGTKECIKILMDTERAFPVINTGWDMTTTKYAVHQNVGLPIGIIAERGHVFLEGDSLSVFYEESSKDRQDFIDTLVDVAASNNLKIAIQPNISGANKSVYIEGDTNGGLNNHFLVKGRALSVDDIACALAQEGCQYKLKEDTIIIDNTEYSRRALYTIMTESFPLLSLRMSYDHRKMVCLKLDHKDEKGFTLSDLETYAKLISTRTRKAFHINEDFCIDFIDPNADAVTKESTARKVAGKKFGAGCWMTNVGDNPTDIFKNDDAIFFAQQGSSAESYAVAEKIPYISVIDGREYALIMHKIKKQNHDTY